MSFFGGGRGQAPGAPAAKKWEDMYLHQKAKHLLDAAGNQIFAFSSYWMPAIAVSGAVTVLLFSGPMGIPQLLQAASMTASPIPAPSTFGLELHAPQGGGGGGGDDMDDMDE